MKWLLWTWIGSLAVTFLVARYTYAHIMAASPVVEAEPPACPVPAPAPPARPGLVERWQPRPAASARATAPKKLELGEPRALDEVTELMMAYAGRKLQEGPEGQLELLAAFDREIMKKQRELRRLADPSDVSRQLYPWLRFLTQHEREMVEMTETVFATMASDPQRFAELDADTLEVFTEGMALLLPGAVSESDLDRFRAYAQAILETPAEDVPEPVQRQMRRIERALEHWEPPIPYEEAIERLTAGPETSRELQRLLRRVDPDAMRALDPVALFRGQLERGDLGAIDQLIFFQLDPAAIAELDERLLSGTTPVQPYAILAYLRNTARPHFELQRAFFQRAAGSPRAASIAEAERLATPR